MSKSLLDLIAQVNVALQASGLAEFQRSTTDGQAGPGRWHICDRPTLRGYMGQAVVAADGQAELEAIISEVTGLQNPFLGFRARMSAGALQHLLKLLQGLEAKKDG